LGKKSSNVKEASQVEMRGGDEWEAGLEGGWRGATEFGANFRGIFLFSRFPSLTLPWHPCEADLHSQTRRSFEAVNSIMGKAGGKYLHHNHYSNGNGSFNLQSNCYYCYNQEYYLDTLDLTSASMVIL
jgi:hypothetical protein